MKEEYISISEFAKRAGVSTQSIYKRIGKKDNPIRKFLKVDNDVATISVVALEEVYGIKNTEEVDGVVNEVVQLPAGEEKTTANKNDTINTYQKMIDILEKQVSSLQEESKRKDILITNLTDTIKQNQVLIDQQQRLSLADKQKILQLEEANESPKRKKFLGIF